MEAAESTTPQQPEPFPPAAAAPAGGELDVTLDHLERLCSRLEHAEQRFKQLTNECEGVLKGLVAVDRQHSSAVASLNERLGEWCNLEGKLLQESARRIEQFERGVGHEWMVIRQMHEEPIAELKDQAAQLRLSCLEAARLARFRLDSAEQAYSAYAADLERRMGEWSHELLKSARKSAEPWPLEGVAQLHQELRTGGQSGGTSLPGRRDSAASSRLLDSPHDGATETPKQRSAWTRPWQVGQWRAASVRVLVACGAVLVLLSLAAYAWWPQAPAPDPADRAVPARPVAAAQAPAEARPAVTESRPAGSQPDAERVGALVEILAAPDLRRYALAGMTQSATSQPYGQVLWSRSRGLAASASRLAPLPEGKVYQLWIVPDGPPAAAGVLVPDPAGRASLVLPGPLKLPLPVTIRVTIEDRGQAASPRGPVYLTRVPIS